MAEYPTCYETFKMCCIGCESEAMEYCALEEPCEYFKEVMKTPKKEMEEK